MILVSTKKGLVPLILEHDFITLKCYLKEKEIV